MPGFASLRLAQPVHSDVNWHVTSMTLEDEPSGRQC